MDRNRFSGDSTYPLIISLKNIFISTELYKKLSHLGRALIVSSAMLLEIAVKALIVSTLPSKGLTGIDFNQRNKIRNPIVVASFTLPLLSSWLENLSRCLCYIVDLSLEIQLVGFT